MSNQEQLSELTRNHLNKRILSLILLTSCFLTGSYSIFYIFFLQANYQMLIITLISCSLFGLLYYLVKYKNFYTSVVAIFIPFSLTILSCGWFFVGGIGGGTGYFYIITLSFFIVLAPFKYRYWLIGAAILNVVILFCIEYTHPTWVFFDQTKEVHDIALLIDIIFSISIVAWTLISVKKEYDEEQNKTKEQNIALINAHTTKARFLANVSHEIRTPMNGVMGMASLLEKTNLTAEQQEYVETIIVSSDRLLRIINQILDFSKAEEGKTTVYNQPFSLAQCVKDAVKINAPHALKKQLELHYKIDSNIPENLLGDDEKLQQILINLIGNAIKFTSSGSIELEVHKQQSDEQRTKLLFNIRDTGIGIPPDKIPDLFQSFTQIDNSRTREYSGTGLGLAICKHLVELLGGQIWIESKLGIGSTVSFTIKMEALSNKGPLPNVKKNIVVNPLSDNKHSLKILIVEDDKINRLLAIRLFEKLGYLPDAVVDGKKAVDLLASTPYDLVFMDIQMPIMDGLEATEVIREFHEHQPVIIAMTANAMAEDKLLCEIAGMDDFVSKPVKLDTLERMLEKWRYSV